MTGKGCQPLKALVLQSGHRCFVLQENVNWRVKERVEEGHFSFFIYLLIYFLRLSARGGRAEGLGES